MLRLHKNWCLMLITLLSAWMVNGQSIHISGKVQSSEQEPLVSASTLLLGSDSTLISFALTDENGLFKIGPVNPGKYILQISYLGFNQANVPVDLPSNKNEITLPIITMKMSENRLDDVVIKGEVTPIIVKKDTLEYNAAAFETRPQDVVEDLLRQMPGVEVEDDGTVVAQGEEVQRVTVDGKDFFREDPKVATKNIAAEAIDAIQFYDRLSDMAEFTGVDDGEREKTMNLKLKEDYRSGYFGNVSAGGGSDNRYEGNLNINRFDPQSQLSLIGNFNNINRQGFSTSEFNFMMGGMGNISGRGRGSDIPSFQGLSNGFVETAAIGMNGNYFPNEKTKVNFSYFINDIENKIANITTRENFFVTGILTSENESNQINNNLSHRLRVDWDQKIDSIQDIEITLGLNFNNADAISQSIGQVFNSSIIQSASMADFNYSASNHSWSGSTMYRRKIGKNSRRSLTLRGSLNQQDSDNNNDLLSENVFYENGIQNPLITQIIQDQLDASDRITYNIRASYIEPLSKKSYLEAHFRRYNTHDDVLREVLDDENGDLIFNPNLSTEYLSDFDYNQYGMTYHWNGSYSSFSIGGRLQNSFLNGQLEAPLSDIQNNNFAVLPTLRWRTGMGANGFFQLNYRTSIQEPTITQLQPVIDNSDPINLYRGNPDLIPEYRHNLSVNYRFFDQFSFSSFFARLSTTYTKNSILNQTNINEQFIRFTTPVNVDYDINTSLRASYNRPLRPLGLKYRINSTLTYRRSILFINESQNLSNRYISRLGFILENRLKKTIDISVGMNLSYNVTRFDTDFNLNQNFLNQTYTSRIVINPSDSWSLESNLRYSLFDDQDFAQSRSVPIWNANLSYNFLDANRAQLQLSVFDLLNRNLGVNRSSTLNYVENSETISLGRYVMLKFSYALKGHGGRSRR